MDALEALGDDRAHAEEARTLGRPVAGRARAVFLAGEHDQRPTLGLVLHGRIVDRHHLFGGEVLGHPALDLRGDAVADADIGKGAAHHHFVVAAPGSVAVEVRHFDPVSDQVLARRRRLADIAGRGDVVGGDGVAEHRQDPGFLDVGHGGRRHGHALEIGRVLDVGGVRVPGIGLAALDLDRLPVLVALEHVGIALGEQGVGDGSALDVRDFLVGRPDVAEIDGLAVRPLAHGLAHQVLLQGSRQGIGHHQGRRGQVVGPDIRIDTALEVPVAGEHGGRHQVTLVDRRGDRGRQGAGIADAGGAPIAHQIETHGVQVFLEAGIGEVVGDHLGSGGQRGLHPRLHLHAASPGLARHQTGGDQDGRVRRVRAGGDGRDDHVPVADIEARLGTGVGLHGNPLGFLAGLAEVTGQRTHEGRGRIGQGDPVLRTLGAREGGLDGTEVELEIVGEHRLFRRLVHPEALGLGIGFHERHPLGRAAGLGEVADRRRADGEEAAGGTVFRRHVGNGRLILEGQVDEARAVEFHELADHALLAQHLCDGEHQVGGRRAFRQLAGQAEADHFGDQHRDRLAEHGGFRLDAADAPAQDG